jgi:predicted transcriptional regulator YheO
MVVYITNLQNSGRESPQLVNKFTNVAGYKISSNKSIALLYINNKWTEKEIRGNTILHNSHK